VEIQPLTRRNKAGEVYQRSPEVTRQIGEALALTPARLIERAWLRDPHVPDYLQEECLVCLIREYHRRGQGNVVDDLIPLLVERCAKRVNDHLQALGPRVVDRAFTDVFDALFDLITDLGSDRGDFLQVRFWVVLDRLRIGTFNRYKDELNQAKQVVPLSSLAGYADEPEDDVGESPRVRSSTTSADAVYAVPVDQGLLVREALRAIGEPYRTAFVLAYYDDWPIEAKDPSVPSISRYFRRTPRTIRNWLDKAIEALGRWRGRQV
jgi:hypothetical protein